MSEYHLPRILIVNDSSIIRRLLTELVKAEGNLELAGTASTGALALQALRQKPVDVVLLDVEMPEMDGIETLSEIRKFNAHLPVIMVSQFTKPGAETTVQALLQGASDYVTLPQGTQGLQDSLEQLRSQLMPKIHELSQHAIPHSPVVLAPPLPKRSNMVKGHKPEMIVLGCSTGGPVALEQVLQTLPTDFPLPILVVQHMPPSFIPALARSLNQKVAIPVAAAQHGQRIKPGVWLAPGDQHLIVTKHNGQLQLQTHSQAPENSCRPSVDVLFRSVVPHYGPRILAVVLTGMGADGLEGAKLIHQAGGQVLVQDEASSVVWGMPGYIARAGLADALLPPAELGAEIMRRSGSQPRRLVL